MNSSLFVSRTNPFRGTAVHQANAAAALRTLAKATGAKPRLSLLAMEPRMLFDGAAAASVVDHDPVAIADSRVLETDQQVVNGQALAGNAWGDNADQDSDGDCLEVLGIVTGDTGGLPKGNVGTTIDGAYGSLSMQADGSYHYAPRADLCLAPGESVDDVFTYTIGDGNGGHSSTTLTLTVVGTEPNQAPVGEIDYRIGIIGETTFGQAVLGNAQGDHADSDPDGDALCVVGVTPGQLSGTSHGNVGQTIDGAYGQLTLQDDGSYTYTAFVDQTIPVGEHRMDVFTYTISDGHGGETSTWIKFHVEGPNHAPEANDDSRSVAHDQAITDGQAVLGDSAGDVTDTDADGHTLHVTGVQAGSSDHVAETGVGSAIQGQYGVLTLNADGSYTYEPNRTGSIAAGQTGQDVFSYLVGDGRGGCDVAQITINVTRPADPVAPIVEPVRPIEVNPPTPVKPGPTKVVDPAPRAEFVEPIQSGKQANVAPLGPFIAPAISGFSAIREVSNAPLRFEMPRDTFAPFAPERVLGEVQEMPEEAPKVAALPTVKSDATAKDDCLANDKPVAKLKPKAVKPSVFAKPIGEAPKRFSEQIQAARKAFKAPVRIAPAPVARDC